MQGFEIECFKPHRILHPEIKQVFELTSSNEKKQSFKGKLQINKIRDDMIITKFSK